MMGCGVELIGPLFLPPPLRERAGVGGDRGGHKSLCRRWFRPPPTLTLPRKGGGNQTTVGCAPIHHPVTHHEPSLLTESSRFEEPIACRLIRKPASDAVISCGCSPPRSARSRAASRPRTRLRSHSLRSGHSRAG